MGNICRSRRQTTNFESAAEANAELLLPGSLAYLELVGMDAHGKLLKDKIDSRLQRPEYLKEIFTQYCEEFLELEHTGDYLEYNGIIQYGYFLRLYKTLFFWKKIRFEKQRLQYMYTRRGLLHQKDIKTYKMIVSKQQEAEEACLQNVLEDLLGLINQDHEIWSASLHQHCQKEQKRLKIFQISNFGNKFANVQLVYAEKEKKMHDLYEENDYEFTVGDILNSQQILHKIIIVQLKDLERIDDNTKALEEYMYFKPKIHDYFYMQTGMEIEDFKSEFIKLRVDQNEKYQQMDRDFKHILEMQFSQQNIRLGLEFMEDEDGEDQNEHKEN